MSREIKGYEGLYAINENAEIINLITRKIKCSATGNHGYSVVDLYKNNKRKTLFI